MLKLILLILLNYKHACICCVFLNIILTYVWKYIKILISYPYNEDIKDIYFPYKYLNELDLHRV